MEADFSGWATKAGLKCSDGRTIMRGAFEHMDKQQVPLVWSHSHNNPENVLGHVLLESRDQGVYAYAFFNNTKQGQNAKEFVQHGDVKFLSIYANQLVEKGSNVIHGMIREVSLVLAGANPGALIENVRIAHSDGGYTELEDLVIKTGEEISLSHSDPDDSDEPDDDETIEHAAADSEELTVEDIYNGMTDEEKNVVHYLIGAALEQKAASSSNAKHSEEPAEGDLTHQEGDDDMSRNVFDQTAQKSGTRKRHELSHDDVRGIVQDAMKCGSLKEAVEGYALKHGIDDIDTLFPDAQAIDNMPQFNTRRMEWVQGVLNGTRHSPFSRVKTIVADITQAEARAKGYIKGNYKIEEWFGVTKRTTDPTTVYKKQKLDRDDVIDITSFDVIAWIKQEMRMMLEEELARAILLGDGRAVDDEDKIKDPTGAPAGDGIRSILNDHELFVTTVNVNVDDADSSYDEVVDAVMDGMEFYKGSGTPNFYTTIRQLNKFLKAKDGVGRRLYQNKQEVAAALGVDQIITVEPMNDYDDLIGIIVNLTDYNIGADKGGEVTTFEDFDIDYNQQKYLIETRLSGALTKIKSAVVVKSTGPTAAMLPQPSEPTFVADTGVVTVPSDAHVVYKNADTGATLSAGAQTALTSGQRLNVQATAASGYYFSNDADTLWSFYKRPAPTGR